MVRLAGQWGFGCLIQKATATSHCINSEKDGAEQAYNPEEVLVGWKMALSETGSGTPEAIFTLVRLRNVVVLLGKRSLRSTALRPVGT
jgi:hypothetical protein